jgi:hypothetical protein
MSFNFNSNRIKSLEKSTENYKKLYKTMNKIIIKCSICTEHFLFKFPNIFIHDCKKYENIMQNKRIIQIEVDLKNEIS